MVRVRALRLPSFICALLLTLSVAAFGREQYILWQPRGEVRSLDFAGGPGGRAAAPVPPFRWLGAEPGGTSPKALIRDARGRKWSIKWGNEAKPETFAARMLWAAGYYAEPTYFIARGKIYGVKDRGRVMDYVHKSGEFKDARFQLRDSGVKFRNDIDWTWKKNPFLGTREFNGLRILVMLLSNWDNKDGSNSTSNTGILQDRRTGRLIYFINDWGASMGAWGGFFTREKWDCHEFKEQSKDFIKGVKGREIEWGFKGKHTDDFTERLTVNDARWLMQRLHGLTDAQIRQGLRASGAKPKEVECFTQSLRARLNQLDSVSR